MAKCAICEKGAHFGNNVSHSNRKTNRIWHSNTKDVEIKRKISSCKNRERRNEKDVCMYFMFKIR